MGRMGLDMVEAGPARPDRAGDTIPATEVQTILQRPTGGGPARLTLLMRSARLPYMEPLTERQRAVLDFVVEYIRVHRFPPTVREIGRALGIRSTNGVSDHLKALERKGYLE